MNPESYRPFDRRGRELEARRSPPARFTSLPTRKESPHQQKPKQNKAPLTQISLQSLGESLGKATQSHLKATLKPVDSQPIGFVKKSV